MSRKKSKKNRGGKSVNKASPLDETTGVYINKQARKTLGVTEIGQPGIVSSSRFIQQSRKTELIMPRFLYTADIMCQDDAVSTSVNFTNMLVVNSLYNGKAIPGKSKSKKSEVAADFLNHCIRNMTYGTWLEFCLNAATDLKYGFSLLNIVTEKAKSGPYRGNRIIKKLSPRSQSSVLGWVWDEKMRDFQGFVQRNNLVQTKQKTENSWLGNLRLLQGSKYYEMGYPYLKREQLIHFTYNSTNNNPQGDSPLYHCYNAWAEKKLIEKFEISGITKGLGGVLLLKIPTELLEKANDPQGRYPEATAEYLAIQQNAADLHAAKNSFMVVPSDVDEVSKTPFYDVKFMGVEGGQANSYDTTKVIDQKRKAIYNTFLTSAILLGQGETGSYALSTNMTSMHGLAVENNLIQKKDVIENQLFKRLLEVNDVHLDYFDMPEFETSDPQEMDLNTASSAIQRMKSVGALTPEMLTWFAEKLGMPIEGISELDFTGENQSRGGDGMATAGEGTSNSTGDKNGGDASVSNTANKNAGAIANLVNDKGCLIDAETGFNYGNIKDFQ